MTNTRKFVLMLAVALTTGVYSSNAQLEVKIRPERPHYEHPVAPSPRHVWIDEEWEPRGGTYVFTGGRWALPPQPGMVWIAGHWKDTHHHGEIWVAGHWRHR